jgi:hypothetical protein
LGKSTEAALDFDGHQLIDVNRRDSHKIAYNKTLHKFAPKQYSDVVDLQNACNKDS